MKNNLLQTVQVDSTAVQDLTLQYRNGSSYISFTKPLEYQFNWKLTRKKDNLTKQSEKIIWVKFNSDGTYLSSSNKISLGACLIMSPFNKYFTWQTTEVTEIIKHKDKYIKFSTTNSAYELFKTGSKN